MSRSPEKGERMEYKINIFSSSSIYGANPQIFIFLEIINIFYLFLISQISVVLIRNAGAKTSKSAAMTTGEYHVHGN